MVVSARPGGSYGHYELGGYGGGQELAGYAIEEHGGGDEHLGGLEGNEIGHGDGGHGHEEYIDYHVSNL